jgi:hypothetical protein
VVVVDAVVVVVVLVVVVAQPPPAHASQQLGIDPTHALPPRGATQRAAVRFTAHESLPELRVRQQVT